MKNSTGKILIYAVIFLGILTIATFSTIGYHIYSSKKAEQQNTENTRTSNNFSGRYFRDRLKLSNDQMEMFRVVNSEFRSQAREINLQLISERKQMMKEMQMAKPDTLKLNQLSDSIGKLHSQLKKASFTYYLNIKEICDSSQVRELDNIFNEFFINDMHFNRQGNRGQHRYGQQRNNY